MFARSLFSAITAFFLCGLLTTTSIAAQDKVEIFVTGWCPYCRQLESFLKKNKVEYTRYDIEQDPRGARLFAELGGEGVPLSRVGKRVVHGYDPEELLSALKTDG